MEKEDQKTHVLILGAGFAGLYTALHLEKKLRKVRAEVEITLVDYHYYHLFTPMLHEAATGVIHLGTILAPIRRILRGKNIHFLHARVDEIDLEAQQVRFCCDQLAYDLLVIALGSVTQFYGLESVAERALEMKDAPDAERLRCHVINRFEAASRDHDPETRRRLLTFAVVGGGCTGVETMAEVHEFLMHLRKEQYDDIISKDEVRTVLVEMQDRVLPQMDRTLSRSALRRMRDMGIEPMLNVTVAKLSDAGLEFAGDQETLPTETVIWAAGVRANPLLDDLPLARDRMGRIEVDHQLRTAEYPNVYVLGDAAHAHHPTTDEVYPPTAQVAYRQAPVAAANILADITGGEHEQFDFTYIGDLVSMGPLSGVADPFGVKLRGVFAWLMWKFYYLLNLVGWQNRVRVAMNWVLALLSPVNSTLPTECPPNCELEVCAVGPASVRA
jgi:NADH dehydrogenase